MKVLSQASKAIQVLIIISLILAGNLFADPGIKIDAQVRIRDENDHKENFIPGRVRREWMDLRTRLGISATLEENTTIYLQLQDSRRLGNYNQFNQPQSGALNDSKNIDAHQAYLKIEHLWKNGPGLKAGRFEVNYGNQRVFGSVGWHNVGRSWEGLTFWVDLSWLKWDYFYLTIEEDPINLDHTIWGHYLNFKKLHTHLFAFWEHDHDIYINNSIRLSKNLLDRFNIGLYYRNDFDNLDFELNAVYQFGDKFLYYTSGNATFADISAYLVTFETGLTVNSDIDLRFAAGFDYSSGDEDKNTGDYKVYENSYYTGHKFRGYMDYFIGSADYGLIDLYLKSGMTITEGWNIKGDLHYFRSDKEYTQYNGLSNDIGVEFDLTVTTTRIAGVKFNSGASVFLPSDNYGLDDSDPGYWFYLMMTAGFDKILK